ncbi:MAG: PLP-dependent transferase [Lachnospiraceae bacterium]|jgi:arginine/lysine/ornithine decarboxylase|nr:PLP-dependent transferase [Lachnospiraceae bacterium]
MSESLSNRLRDLAAGDIYPFHMPGHKRVIADGMMESIIKMWYSCDISEISGFDNLHHPQGILLTIKEKAAALYHAEESFCLINGSTAGILSAVAALGTAKKLLVSRDSHLSVYHAAYLFGISLVYASPQESEIAAKLASDPDIEAILITSPSYEGISHDVAAIARLAYYHNIPLIVDQAHGAHFGLHPDLSENAVRQGADIVVHSLHKTLPSLTQTALLHVCGKRIDRRVLRRYLRIFQSSSPSYPLLVSIEQCIDMMETEGAARFDQMLTWRQDFIDQVSQLKKLYIDKSQKGNDPCKIVIRIADGSQDNQCRDMTGGLLADILRKDHHLEMEYFARDYVVAIVTVMDKHEGFVRLAKALSAIDRSLVIDTKAKEEKRTKRDLSLPTLPEAMMTITEAYNSEMTEIALPAAAGNVAAEFVVPYPPGIPLLVPGERIDAGILEVIQVSLASGITINGLSTTANGEYTLPIIKTRVCQ